MTSSTSHTTNPTEDLPLDGPLGRVHANSATHWALLVLGMAASIAFTTGYLLEGALRPGYDWVRQPISALALGPDGWVQSLNFILFGLLSCATAFASRPTLTPGFGARWYPRLRLLSGVALICTGLVDQDPGRGYPVGIPAPLHPSLHAQLHNLVSVVSLVAVVGQLTLLGIRFSRERRWRGWAVSAFVAAVAMMACLAVFGALTAQGGPAGVFEKVAGVIPAVFGIAFTGRLISRRDARVTAAP